MRKNLLSFKTTKKIDDYFLIVNAIYTVKNVEENDWWSFHLTLLSDLLRTKDAFYEFYLKIIVGFIVKKNLLCIHRIKKSCLCFIFHKNRNIYTLDWQAQKYFSVVLRKSDFHKYAFVWLYIFINLFFIMNKGLQCRMT